MTKLLEIVYSENCFLVALGALGDQLCTRLMSAKVD